LYFLSNTLQSLTKRKRNYKVGFIVIGAQKSGTTALDHYLRLHPDICMAYKKEVHYFDNNKYFLNNNPDYSKYHSFFNPNHKHKILGESTPIYMYWNKAIQRIHAYNPYIKLIAILRNPIKRAFSHWNMERDRNREDRSFLEAIIDEDSKINSYDHIQHKTFSYLERGFYSSQIQKIYKFFQEDQLMLIRNKSLRENPNQVLDAIAKFLSISSFSSVDNIDIHSRHYTRKMNDKELNFLKSFYEEEFNSLEELVDWNIASWKE
tara:strand:- start:1084 stop:1872 length:789 start_codon:yes stop_codon:yes gene_type:complete